LHAPPALRQPHLPLLPLYPLIVRSPPHSPPSIPTPSKCIDTDCPNPNWPKSYCTLYVGVPIRCPCLCAV
jgi:hypothetical protein